MTEEDENRDSNHLSAALTTTKLGAMSLVLAIYHIVLGFSEWTKNRHIVIQAGITLGVSIALVQITNIIGQFFLTTFWQEAIYASGLRLRLLPIPISLVIYAMVLTILLLGFSLDSSIRELQSEIDEIKKEIDTPEEDSE